MDCHDGELSVLIVDDPQIEKLNREYMHRTGPTNVLAFSMREGDFGHISPHLLGDVVISVETADSESRMMGIPLEKRLFQLLVHGILHLFGYDHTKNGVAERRMDAENERLLDLIDHLEFENED